MGENAEGGFADAAGVAGGCQRGAEAALELGDGAFDLPALGITAAGKAALHFFAVAPGLHASCKAPIINGYGSARNAQMFAAERVKRFAVVRAIGGQGVQGQVLRRGGERVAEMAGVVGRCQIDDGTGDQVRGVLADKRQLDPRAVLRQPRRAFQEIATDVVAFQACGVDRSEAVAGEQSAVAGGSENTSQQPFNGPFFSRRCSAFWSVVKWGKCFNSRMRRNSPNSPTS